LGPPVRDWQQTDFNPLVSIGKGEIIDPSGLPLAINVLKVSMDMIFDFGFIGLKSP